MKKSTSCLLLFSFLFWSAYPSLSWAMPTGYTVESGDVAFDASDPLTLVITASDQAIINFSDFSILQNETVRFIQPSETASVLSRVTGGAQSDIWGSLLANGQLVFINSNGIYFHDTANVEVGSLIASTLEIQNAMYLANQLTFEKEIGSNPGSILNEGTITAAEGGYVALLSERVQNSGTIIASLGSVVLGAGEKQTLSFDSNGLVNLVIDEGVAERASAEPLIDNAGILRADGGKVILGAKEVSAVLDQLVNNSGIIQAVRAVERDGKIVFEAEGGINLQGTISTNHLEINGGTMRYAAEGEIDNLTIRNGTMILQRALVVNQNVLIEGGTLDAAGEDLTVKGDFMAADGQFRMALLHALTFNVLGEIVLPEDHFTVYVDPAIFGLDASAREVPSLRTPTSLTFEVSPGRFAAVSLGEPLFRYDENMNLVPVERFGRTIDDTFVFHRLPDGIEVSFDLDHPAYTLSQGDYHYTVTFNAEGRGVVERGDTVAYRLSDNTVLRWRVMDGLVVKNIYVENGGATPDLSFYLTTSDNLSALLENNQVFLRNDLGETVFETQAPFLIDLSGNMLADHPVDLLDLGGGIYDYAYDAGGLDFPYILDPSAGPNFPSTVADDSSIGTVAWTNPTNATTSNNSYATITMGNFVSTFVGHYLKATDFGFSIPNSTVDGIVVEWERYAGGVSLGDNAVRIVKGGTIGSTDKSLAGLWSTSEGFVSYGGATDLWGETWTSSDINASTFGAALAPDTVADGSDTGRVDSVRMTVYYTLNSSPGGGDGDGCPSCGEVDRNDDGATDNPQDDPGGGLEENDTEADGNGGDVSINPDVTPPDTEIEEEDATDTFVHEGTVYVIDRRTGQVHRLMDGEKSRVTARNVQVRMRELYVTVGDGLLALRGKTLETLKKFKLKESPSGIAASTKGDKVYAAFHRLDELNEIDTASFAVKSLVKNLKKGAADLVINTAADTAFVATRDDEVKTFDVKTGALLRTWPTGGMPASLALSEDEKFLYVTEQLDHALSKYEAATGRKVASVLAGKYPHGVAVADGKIFVTDRGSGRMFAYSDDLKTPLAAVFTGKEPYAIEPSPDGSRVFVTTRGEGTVSIIDTKNFQILSQVRVGEKPSGLTVLPENDKLYVTNQLSGTLSEVSVKPGEKPRVLQSVYVGSAPDKIGLSTPAKK